MNAVLQNLRPLTSFKVFERIKTAVDIKDLVCEPTRSQRPERIVIIIRGTSGSEKTHVANLILKEEQKQGNVHSLVLRATNNDQDGLVCKLRAVVEEDSFRFIIIEIEGGGVLYMNKILHVATKLAQKPFQCFAFEISQSREVCSSITLEDPVHPGKTQKNQKMCGSKFSNCYGATCFPVNLQVSEHAVGFSEGCSTSSPVDSFLRAKDWLEDKKVMQIVRRMKDEDSSFPHPLMQRESFQYGNFKQNGEIQVEDFLPKCSPRKISDYSHTHVLTLSEHLSEFRIHKIFEYGNKSKPNSIKLIEDVDLDKIIQKRKKIAMRKKILQLLKLAERPEDTVSNPKYPNNWKKIETERPARRNKRKKILSDKVKRAKDAHCMKCFENQMLFDDFSSDERF